jgi:predicted GIY-YIG superfamily endonuclease
MYEERVAIVDLADELQVRKQRIFKLLQRLGIRATQRREPERGNQNVATVSLSEAAAIRQELARAAELVTGEALHVSKAGIPVALSDDVGFFYIIQLEPDHDPGRFKVGFTTDLEGRLQKHRCSAPFAKYLRSWPCRRLWERAAMDCATDGCEQLHTEVFRTASLDAVASRADTFFSVMPRLASTHIEQETEALDEEQTHEVLDERDQKASTP